MADIIQTTLNGFFKDAYGKISLVKTPESILQKLFPFSTEENLGGYFKMPIEVSRSHSATKGGESATSYSLDSVVSLVTEEIKVRGSQITFRERMSIGVASRAASSRSAFLSATELIVKSLHRQAYTTTELDLMHGRTGLGRTSTSVNQSATQTRITIDLAYWALMIWSGTKNKPIQFFQSNGTLVGTTFTVNKIDQANRYIYVDGASGDITALDAAIAAPATLQIHAFCNGVQANEMIGLHYISGNVSGSLFGLSAATYEVMQSNVFNANGTLSITKLFDYIGQMGARGMTENAIVIVPWSSWTNLSKDALAMMEIDSAKSQIDIGVEGITLKSPVGKLKIVQHPYVMEGFSYIVPEKGVKRIGSTDITFKDVMGREYFIPLIDSNAFEMRAFTDQALFSDNFVSMARIEGIVN